MEVPHDTNKRALKQFSGNVGSSSRPSAEGQSPRRQQRARRSGTLIVSLIRSVIRCWLYMALGGTDRVALGYLQVAQRGG